MEDRDRVGGSRVVSATLGSVIASMWSPATSETVRLIRRAGGAAARQPPALERRDVLADRVDLDDPDPRREQQLVQVALLGSATTPAGGRLASAELPPVKQAITRSRSPAPPAMLEQAPRGGDAALARQRVVGARAPRSAAERSAARRRGRRSPRRRGGRRGSARARAAIPSEALPAPTTITLPAGVEPVADAVDDQLVARPARPPARSRGRTSQAASPAAATRSAARGAPRARRVERAPRRSRSGAAVAARARLAVGGQGRSASGGDRRAPRARRRGRRRSSPSSSEIRIRRLYLAVRSPRTGAPVLIWPAPRATARSAMIGSSVSPERSETTTL